MAARNVSSLKDMVTSHSSLNPNSNSQSLCPSLLQTGSEALINEAAHGVDMPGKWYAGFRWPLYPPPISCLKLFKTGKPYTYLEFNKSDDSFSIEEMKIPDQFLLASRQNGCLKLYFAFSDEFSGKGEGEESESKDEDEIEEEDMNLGEIEGNL